MVGTRERLWIYDHIRDRNAVIPVRAQVLQNSVFTERKILEWPSESPRVLHHSALKPSMAGWFRLSTDSVATLVDPPSGPRASPEGGDGRHRQSYGVIVSIASLPLRRYTLKSRLSVV
jgi:hypothetical protein